MRNRLSVGLALLRATGVGAVLVLLVNPTWSRPVPTTAPPLVLLDASLSMAAPAGPWRAALDSARRLASGGPIWRFGGDAEVTAFDTSSPAAGATRLGPGLAAAAARGGPVVVITDGAVTDAADLPPTCAAGPACSCCPVPSSSTRTSPRSTGRAASSREIPCGCGSSTERQGGGTGDGGRGLPSRSPLTHAVYCPDPSFFPTAV